MARSVQCKLCTHFSVIEMDVGIAMRTTQRNVELSGDASYRKMSVLSDKGICKSHVVFHSA